MPRGVRLGTAAALVLGLAFVALFAFSRGRTATQGPPERQETTPTAAAERQPASEATAGPSEVPSSEEKPGASAARKLSDADLYHEASVAFDRGDLEASKAVIEELLRRNPGFDGAPELLVKVNERLRGEERSPVRAGDRAPPVEPAHASAPMEAELFYRARLAFQNGDIEGSKRQLEALLRTNPSFEGASELLLQVNDELWKKTLPVSFRAEHQHRIRGCTGTLTLAAWGIRFSSTDHDWKWKFDEIRLIERQGGRVLNLETYETEVLGLGKPKNYKFELRESMGDEDWSRYERLAR
jgi:hypothetical protein